MGAVLARAHCEEVDVPSAKGFVLRAGKGGGVPLAARPPQLVGLAVDVVEADRPPPALVGDALLLVAVLVVEAVPRVARPRALELLLSPPRDSGGLERRLGHLPFPLLELLHALPPPKAHLEQRLELVLGDELAVLNDVHVELFAPPLRHGSRADHRPLLLQLHEVELLLAHVPGEARGRRA